MLIHLQGSANSRFKLAEVLSEEVCHHLEIVYPGVISYTWSFSEQSAGLCRVSTLFAGKQTERH